MTPTSIFYNYTSLVKTIKNTQNYVKCILSGICIFVLASNLIGCNEQQVWEESNDDNGHILIGQSTVTLTPNHILSIKSEQYQPSLTLVGRVLPNEQTTITSPSTAKVNSLNVKKGDMVKKDDILFTLKDSAKTIVIDNLVNNNSLIDYRNQQANIQNILAPFDGVVTQIYTKNSNTLISKGDAILKLETPNKLKFIGLLPQYTKSRISVGQHVNFTVKSPKNSDQIRLQTNLKDKILYTGQVSEVIELESSHKVAVHVHILNDADTTPPPIGTSVQGKLDYGQLDVGTIVTQEAVHGTGLSIFTKAENEVLAPVKAHVWIVNQDSTLSYQAVEVIRYNENGNNYLVSGIPSESLIVNAKLPPSAVGKRLKIS